MWPWSLAMFRLVLVTLQRILSREVAVTNGTHERLLTAAASHSLICMSMGIVSATKSLPATFGAVDTAGPDECGTMRLLMHSLHDASSTNTILGGEKGLFSGGRLVLR